MRSHHPAQPQARGNLHRHCDPHDTCLGLDAPFVRTDLAQGAGLFDQVVGAGLTMGARGADPALDRAWVQAEGDDTDGGVPIYLSTAYAEQSLLLATRYYALTGPFIGVQSDAPHLKPRIASFPEYTVVCEDLLGAWHGFHELAEASAIFYPHYTRAPAADFNRTASTVSRLMCHRSAIRLLTQLLHSAVEPFATARTTSVARRAGLAEVLAELVTHGAGLWTARGQRELWQDIGEPIAGPPWNAAGAVRTLRWTVLRVTPQI